MSDNYIYICSENARLQQENSVYTKWHQPDQEHLNELTRMRAQFSEEVSLLLTYARFLYSM